MMMMMICVGAHLFVHSSAVLSIPNNLFKNKVTKKLFALNNLQVLIGHKTPTAQAHAHTHTHTHAHTYLHIMTEVQKFSGHTVKALKPI